MLEPIKFNKGLMRGREPKNLVNESGVFALAPELKPKLLGGLTIACGKSASEVDITAAALLAVLTGRRINFVFCAEDDPAWCEADFVFVRDTTVPTLFGDDPDSLCGVISIVSNTAWCKELFPVPDGLELFLQEVWKGCYDTVATKLTSGHISGKSPDKVAGNALVAAKLQIADYFKLTMLTCVIYNKLEKAVKDHPDGVLILPHNAMRLGELTVQRRVLMLEGQREKDPIIALTGVYEEYVGTDWVVVTAHTLTEMSDESAPCMSISAPLQLEFGPDFSVQIEQDGFKYEADRSGSERVICKTRSLAMAFAAWLRDKFRGKEAKLHEYIQECTSA